MFVLSIKMTSYQELKKLPLTRLRNIARQEGLIGPNVFSRIDENSRSELIDALNDFYNRELEEIPIGTNLCQELVSAVKDQDYNRVLSLLVAGADPLAFATSDYNGTLLDVKDTPVYLAIRPLDNLTKEEKRTAIKIFDALLYTTIRNYEEDLPLILDELLYRAVDTNNIPAAEYLLFEGADPDSVIKYASDKGYEEMINLLLDYDANPDLI